MKTQNRRCIVCHGDRQTEEFDGVTTCTICRDKYAVAKEQAHGYVPDAQRAPEVEPTETLAAWALWIARRYDEKGIKQ